MGQMNNLTPNLSYVVANGISSNNVFIEIFKTRAPLPQDRNYAIQQRWLNTLTNQEYILTGFSTINGNISAIWSQVFVLSNEQITGNDGVPVVSINNNLNLLGNVVANGTHATALFTITPALGTENIDLQVAAANASSSIAKAGIASFNSLAFSVDANGFVSLTGTGIAQTLTGNTGGAIAPVAGNINTVGTGSITISGAGNTLTTQLTGLTNHAVFVGAGTATITNVGPSSTTGQILQNNAAADPSYSTATYPSTTVVSQLLYSSATNTVAGLATSNNGVLTTSAIGVPQFLANGTNGQVLTATTGSPPTWQNPIQSLVTYTNVTFAMSPYTVLASDEYLSLNTSGGAITLLFPNTTTTNRIWVVKDRTGNASTNNVSITTVGGAVTIDTQTTYKLFSNFSSVSMIFNASNYEIY